MPRITLRNVGATIIFVAASYFAAKAVWTWYSCLAVGHYACVFGALEFSVYVLICCILAALATVGGHRYARAVIILLLLLLASSVVVTGSHVPREYFVVNFLSALLTLSLLMAPAFISLAIAIAVYLISRKRAAAGEAVD